MERIFKAPEIIILVFQSCDKVEDGLPGIDLLVPSLRLARVYDGNSLPSRRGPNTQLQPSIISGKLNEG